VAIVVPPGITILYGPSGAGKSTTLAIAAGLLRPDEGRVALGDRVWFDARRGELVPAHRRRVALVFQSLALFPHLSSLENVAYGVSRSLSAQERRARASAALEKMRAGHLADRPPRSLSGGEAQRVALARALAMDPSVLLLDEPFAALDPGLRAELEAELRAEIARLAVPVLWVTHLPREALSLGNHLVLLRGGSVAGAGAPSSLVGSEEPTS
jgi:molybdate transport system ATP-binding protein